MSRFGKKKNKSDAPPSGGAGPDGIDPESPEARRANNVKEIKFEDLRLHFLIIKINRGIDLKAADITMKGGSSDPFVEVIANNQKFVTKVIEKNLNPEWNEETTFCFFELVRKLEFKVFDWDKGEFGKHDAIGNCFLDTSNFFEKGNNGFEGDITLQNVKKGKLNVKVMGRLIVPRELEVRCENLTKEKAAQQIQVDAQEKVLNELSGVKDELTSEKQKNESELQMRSETLENKTNERDELVQDIEETKKSIEDARNETKQMETDTTEAATKTAVLTKERDELLEQKEEEVERRERLLETMGSHRDTRKRLSGIGGKGIGAIGGMAIKRAASKDVDTIDENTASGVAGNPIKQQSMSSVNPEVGHMNVSWIRQNAPRQSLQEYQASSPR